MLAVCVFDAVCLEVVWRFVLMLVDCLCGMSNLLVTVSEIVFICSFCLMSLLLFSSC